MNSFFGYDRERLLRLNNVWFQKLNLDSFIFLKTSSFISFFLYNQIDVPVCFKKSKSLSFKSFELPVLKLFNFLMKQGLRDKNLKTFFYHFSNLKKKFDTKVKYPSGDLTKINKYDTLVLNKTFFLASFSNNLEIIKNYTNKNNKFIKILYLNFFFYKLSNFKLTNRNRSKKLNTNWSMFTKNSIVNTFSKPNIIFSYYVYSVDKNVRKFSRGKSGKYTFVWKYVAPYKRIFLAMKLFSKNLKFKSEKKFYKNFLNSFFFLKNNFNKSFLYKFKNYTHNFVFKNFKKNSMLSLKTINTKKQ